MSKKKKLSAASLAAFSEEMANVLSAGISSIEGVTLLFEEAEDPEEKEILGIIKETILSTGSFSLAIEDTKLFPEYYRQMITLGEQTGRLDEMLSELAAYYAREASIKQSIRNAVSYPLLMIVMMVLVIVVLIVEVMPIFERVFASLGSSMTGFSAGLLSAGNVIKNYAVIFAVLIVAAAVFGFYLFKNDGARTLREKLAYTFKGTRRIYEKMSAARFAGALSVALKSGMSNTDALEHAIGVVDDSHFKKKVEQVVKLITEENAMMATALFDAKLFPGVYGRMLKMSERAGNTEEVLTKIASVYKRETDDEIDAVISVIEPTLVIILSLLVGAILLSVMLPLLGIMSGING